MKTAKVTANCAQLLVVCVSKCILTLIKKCDFVQNHSFLNDEIWNVFSSRGAA